MSKNLLRFIGIFANWSLLACLPALAQIKDLKPDPNDPTIPSHAIVRMRGN